MSVLVDSVPAPADAETALFGWRVGTPDRQEATVAAIAAAQRSRPWPGPGLRSYGVLAGDDGDTLPHYSQIDGQNPVSGQDLTLPHPGPGIDALTAP